VLTACAPAATPTPKVVTKVETKVVTKVVMITPTPLPPTPVPPTATPAKPVGPVYGGSLVSALGTTGIRGFKTWQDTTGNETHVYTVLYDTFVRYDDEYNLVGGLFESWETEDAQTWVFRVRKGVKWHDGVELVAQHVIDYIDTVLDPEAGAASETSDLFEGASYEALDKYTVKLVLPRPDAALLDGLTAQWLCRVEDFDESHPIATGPFKFVEWKRNEYIKFERNEDYWREGLPYLNELTIMMVPDATTRMNMLLLDEIQATSSVSLAEVAKLELQEDVQIIKTPDQYMITMWYMLMKCSEPPFDDARVRRAVNLAIDREDLLEITFGYGWLKSNAVADGSWAFNPNGPSYNKQDMEQAKELMKEAGYEPGEPAFTVSLKYWKEWPENLLVCQIVQANLAELGIQVELELLEIGTWVDTVLWDHEYEMALTALVPRWDPNDQLGNVYRTDDGAALEWENAEFDKYWLAGRATADIEERKAAYWKCQEIAMQECPCAILNGAPMFAAAAANVRDLIRYNRADLLYERAWIEP